MVEKIEGVKTTQIKNVTNEGCQTAPQPVPWPIPDTHKRPETTVSPEETTIKKPGEKRLETFGKEEIPARKDLRKGESTLESRNQAREGGELHDDTQKFQEKR